MTREKTLNKNETAIIEIEVAETSFINLSATVITILFPAVSKITKITACPNPLIIFKSANAFGI